MKYNKEAVESFINNDRIEIERLTKEKDITMSVLVHVQNGLFYDHACAVSGLSERQFHVWKRRKAQFAQAIKISDSRAIARHNENIQKKALDEQGDWRASTWFLSKKDKRYREEQVIEHEGEIRTKTIINLPPMENK